MLHTHRGTTHITWVPPTPYYGVLFLLLDLTDRETILMITTAARKLYRSPKGSVLRDCATHFSEADFTQSLFLHVIEKQHLFDPTKSCFNTWVNTVAFNFISTLTKRETANFSGRDRETGRTLKSKTVSGKTYTVHTFVKHVSFDAPLVDGEPESLIDHLSSSMVDPMFSENNDNYSNLTYCDESESSLRDYAFRVRKIINILDSGEDVESTRLTLHYRDRNIPFTLRAMFTMFINDHMSFEQLRQCVCNVDTEDIVSRPTFARLIHSIEDAVNTVTRQS